VNVRIDYCSYGSCAVDFFDAKPLQINYRYFASLNELKEELRNDRVWPPKVERFEKWLKAYDVVADLGYLVVYNKERRAERIINIHIYYSVWLRRPVLRVADISEFTIEVEEEEDDP
jgi:hypothetical protein